MYFPIAEIEVNPLVPPLVAFIISFFTSMGGVSGAFLLLPFQISVLGFNTPSVSATNHLFNVTAIPGGVYRYFKEGRMVWPLTWIVTIGTLPGVFIGAILRIHYLPDPQNFKIFAGFVLLYIGGRLLNGISSGKKGSNAEISEEQFQQRSSSHKSEDNLENEVSETEVKEFNISHIVYEFYNQRFEVHTGV